MVCNGLTPSVFLPGPPLRGRQRVVEGLRGGNGRRHARQPPGGASAAGPGREDAVGRVGTALGRRRGVRHRLQRRHGDTQPQGPQR